MKKTGLPAAEKPLAPNQAKAKKILKNLNHLFSNEAISEQKPGHSQISLPAEKLASHLTSIQTEPESTSDAADCTIITSSTFPDDKPSEDNIISEHTSANSRLSPVINDKLAIFQQQLAYLSSLDSNLEAATFLQSGSLEALRTAPLFSGKVLDSSEPDTLNQYGLLCKALATREGEKSSASTLAKPALAWNEDPRVFINVNTPWSIFTCGSQGSGKSYTLSCILENCLIPSGLGKLPKPLAAMVFHYDNFVSIGSKQLCEAAYLCSAGVPVRVLVSPTNYWQMKEAYEGIPLSSASGTKPRVFPIKFQDKHLNVSRMMNMMAVSDKDGPPPLYIEVWIMPNPYSRRGSF